MQLRTTPGEALELVVNALGRFVVRAWLRTAEMSDPLLPRPESPDRRPAPDHDADRLLLLGNGPTVGYGVLSHDLSLAGHLGRQLTRETGRPTHVTVLADSALTAGSALAALRSADLEPYDGIVVTVGVNEVLSLSSRSRWRREIVALVRFIRSPAAPLVRTYFVGIPPMRSISTMPRVVEWLTDRHAARLNQVLADVCAAEGRATFVPFAPGRSPDSGGYRSTEVYRSWAAILVEPIAAGLSRDHPGDGGIRSAV